MSQVSSEILSHYALEKREDLWLRHNTCKILLLIFILRIKDQKDGILGKKKSAVCLACVQRIICVGNLVRLRRKYSRAGCALFV